jgi:hypothetical protein
MNIKIHTHDGCAAAEQRIARDQEIISSYLTNAVDESLFHALVLIGGYGRGEGGYYWRDGKPYPYNDYDYFLVVKDTSRRVARKLQQQLQPLAHQLHRLVDVEVDVAVLRLEDIARLPLTLMHSEMQWGHRVIAGDINVLASMPPMPWEKLPAGEFTRLMNNRGSLLLMNRQLLDENRDMAAQDTEQFYRYVFKAVLACGDAWLAMHDRYHPSYHEKSVRLEQMPIYPVEDFMTLYQEAVRYKFNPVPEQYADEDPVSWQDRAVSCWLGTLWKFESNRLGYDIGDWQHYASIKISKGQSESENELKNILITMRDFGLMHTLTHLFLARRYPRERMIGILPSLLSQKSYKGNSPGDLPALLGQKTQLTVGQLTGHYFSAWPRYA